MSTRRCPARQALRIRVSMSETGSVMLIVSGDVLSPTGLAHPGDFPLEREFAEADTTQAELAEIRPRAPAALAAVVLPHRELGRPLLLLDQRLLSHATAPLR